MESTLRDTAPAGLVIIETLAYTPQDGFTRLGLHVDRAEETCAKLGFAFDRGTVLQALGEAVGTLPARVRLTIGDDGQVAVTTGDLVANKDSWKIGVSPVRLQSDDPWLAVKTSKRATYDDARAALPSEIDEVIFMNERDEVCEGTITNVFVKRNGDFETPPLTCGVLPGVLRQEMLITGSAIESALTLSDLESGEIYVGNSLRGLIKAQLVLS